MEDCLAWHRQQTFQIFCRMVFILSNFMDNGGLCRDPTCPLTGTWRGRIWIQWTSNRRRRGSDLWQIFLPFISGSDTAWTSTTLSQLRIAKGDITSETLILTATELFLHQRKWKSGVLNTLASAIKLLYVLPMSPRAVHFSKVRIIFLT